MSSFYYYQSDKDREIERLNNELHRLKRHCGELEKRCQALGEENQINKILNQSSAELDPQIIVSKIKDFAKYFRENQDQTRALIAAKDDLEYLLFFTKEIDDTKFSENLIRLDSGESITANSESQTSSTSTTTTTTTSATKITTQKSGNAILYRTNSYLEPVSESIPLRKYFDEWKGKTQSAGNIKIGIEAIEKLGYTTLFQIKGDNYCGLRSTFFSLLLHGKARSLPPFIRPEEFFKNNSFLAAYSDIGILNHYIHTYQNFLNSVTVFQKPELIVQEVRRLLSNEQFDIQVMEALKYLMLVQATKWFREKEKLETIELSKLFFSRSNVLDPREFALNILQNVGTTLGLEQIEMILLADTLGVQIKVFRLVYSGESDFETIFTANPGSELEEVPIVTVDDRHYNVITKMTV